MNNRTYRAASPGKIIAAGHICLDITPVFPDENQYKNISNILIPGKLINVNAANVSTGGSVANTGLALKLLGNDVVLMGKVGDDAFGKMIHQLLEGHGVGGLLVDQNSSTSYSVVLAIPGMDRIFLHNPGANDTFTDQDIPEEVLEDTVLFHFGYPPLMKTMYIEGGNELAAILRRVKEKGIATSLDMAAIDPNSDAGKVDWRAILENVLPYTDFFVPSFEELCFMLNRDKYDILSALGGDMIEHIRIEQDVKPLATELLRMGTKFVLIKCGTAGMYYCSGDVSGIGNRLQLDNSSWSKVSGFQPCFQAETVRSATGAGDTSIAAFLTAVLCGKSPAQCAALAAAEGACAVTSYDALGGLKPIEKLEAMIKSGWKTN